MILPMRLGIDEVETLAEQFITAGLCTKPIPFGGGHINDTYLLACDGQQENVHYILQRINQVAFPRPDQVLDNMMRVTDHLKEEIKRSGGDPTRETIDLCKTRDGASYSVDRNGDFWRMYRFIDSAVSYDTTDDVNVMREAGRIFGRFMNMLSGFDTSSLYETIVDFHHTPKRFDTFGDAVRRDAMGRGKDVAEMVEAAYEYEAFSSTLVDGCEAGLLPLRVTHNDTKLNNVLIDKATGKGLCAIDLDTVMPGLTAYDFGDAIRYGANTAAEDEQNLDLVELSLPMYKAYAEGFLGEVKESLTEAEIDSLPVGAKMMTLECMIRFLGDYLNGDVYFKVAYPDHNLVRAKTQLKLLREMDAHWDEMVSIIKTLAGGTTGHE